MHSIYAYIKNIKEKSVLIMERAILFWRARYIIMGYLNFKKRNNKFQNI